jgi:pectinesterase
MVILAIAALIFAAVHCSPVEFSSFDDARSSNGGLIIFPANKATNINPDTHLVLTFPSTPRLGTSGFIRVYDAADKKLIDTINLSIPTSPNPSGRAPGNHGTTTAPGPADPNDKRVYQVNTVGGVDFHFFPVIVRDKTATISLHNNVLKFGRTYIVKIDPQVLHSSDGSFSGFTTDNSWMFSTKASLPSDTKHLVVAEDGTGDFNTLQGAIDYIPDCSSNGATIFIKNGNYEEIIFIQKKSNIVIRGESRDKVVVGYPNNSAFNPAKTGPSRRVAFTIYNSNDIQLSSFTINNYFIGQAEALLVRGQRIIIDHMTLHGSGDAFTTYGTIYFADSKLTGDGDTVLGYGAVYFLRSEIDSIGPITWTRTPTTNHGNVFVNCTLVGIDKPLPWTVTESNPRGQKSKSVFARLPQNGRGNTSSNFRHAEMVLINTKTNNVPPEGWGPIQNSGFDTSQVHFWEYNTMDMEGRAIDMSKRHPVSKQLTIARDAKIISDYSMPEFVLNGWKPDVK